MGKLYSIATPIGNLEDISARALRVLSEVDMVLCEDTRVSKKLLAHYKIETKTQSYHSHSTQEKEDALIRLLQEGATLALISDSGTPTLSDPGVKLISRVYEVCGENVDVIAIPGPSAVATALSISGLPASDFLFLGFLPHKKGRETLFKEIAASKRTVVFYESPHRFLKTLQSLREHIDTSRTVVVARELTKLHEEIQRGSAEDVLEHFTNNPSTVKGEFVILVSGR